MLRGIRRAPSMMRSHPAPARAPKRQLRSGGRLIGSKRQSTGGGCEPNGRCITMEMGGGNWPGPTEHPCNDNCGCDHLDNVVGNTCEVIPRTGAR